MLSAKSLVGLIAAAGITALSSAAAAATIDLNTPEGVVKVNRKIQCNLQDNKEEAYVWHGRAYSRVPGERDKHLFNLQGYNIRQCTTVNDPKRGEGFRQVSREIMLYLDPKTNEVLKTWENPWTGETVDVIHVANDPVNGRPTFGKTAEGKTLPFRHEVIGNTWQANWEIPLFYTNPLAGDYQKYVGGTYHATEIFDFYGDYKELLDDSKDTAYARVAWVRISDWLPWMEMGSRSGDMYFNAQGGKVESWDLLPEVMKEAIAKDYPKYRHAPPVDDKRPNETSWTYFKKVLDKRAAKQDKKASGSGH